jgi:hypothetical protein
MVLTKHLAWKKVTTKDRWTVPTKYLASTIQWAPPTVPGTRSGPSTEELVDGALLGIDDKLGLADGARLGVVLGVVDGALEGDTLGVDEGLAEGPFDGDALGLAEELLEGDADGLAVGLLDGLAVGLLVGLLVGASVGLLVGASVGLLVGASVGLELGLVDSQGIGYHMAPELVREKPLAKISNREFWSPGPSRNLTMTSLGLYLFVSSTILRRARLSALPAPGPMR